MIALVAVGCTAIDQPSAPPSGAPPTSTESGAVEPFFDARAHEAEYVGPGREVPPPDELEEVKIGWFGPSDPNHPLGGGMWCAAQLALEEANQSGGYRGLSFRFVATWSENPWGSGIKGVSSLVYNEKVWAIVGGPDGPSAHLVEQIVAKARLAFVSPVATDKTANLANVPWIFSCAPGDHLQAPLLAQALVRVLTDEDATPAAHHGAVSPRGLKPVAQKMAKSFAIISGTDHDSRMFATELLAAFGKLQAFPGTHVEFHPGGTDFGHQLEGIRRADAVAVIGGPRDAARLLVALRTEGLSMPVFGGPRMGHRLFLEIAGPAAEGVVFPLLWESSKGGREAKSFAQRFRKRFGGDPDYTAAHTYDAVNMLVAAIRQSGLNRVRIRDALRELSPWPGVSGPIVWDPTGHNRRPVHLGTICEGQVLLTGP